MAEDGTAFVALHVGAWIETLLILRGSGLAWSRSTWARGLKQGEQGDEGVPPHVALHVGAWIETRLKTLTNYT